FAAALRQAPRLGPAASSRTSLALPARACSAPLAPPERTDLAARRVTLHRTASEPLDRSSLGTGVLVRIDQRNRCTLSGVAHLPVARQGIPICSTPLRAKARICRYLRRGRSVEEAAKKPRLQEIGKDL